MAAINASTNGNTSTVRQCSRRAFVSLIVFSFGAAFITDRVAFSYPVPMLDGPLTLVIPAHNEAANMVKVMGGSVRTLSGLAPEWEIVLVDDGSTDNTVDVARRAMGADAGRLRVIRHDAKRGYGVTVADGLRSAHTDYVAFMDGDGQFDPGDLTTLAGLMGSADLPAGWRQQRAGPRDRLVSAGA